MAAASIVDLHLVNPFLAKSSPRLSIDRLKRRVTFPSLFSSPPCSQRHILVSAPLASALTPVTEQVAENAADAATVGMDDGGRLYVGNLPYSLTSPQLSEIFGEAGNVVAAEVVCERTPERRSRGFGFVTMASTEEANEAIRMFNGSQLLGRTMKVNFPEVPRGGERAIMGPRIRRSSRAFVETPHKIYAGNLAWTVTSEGLRSAFEAQSGLVGAKVVYERDSGKSRGFGFVSFQSLEDAESALAAMNGGELEGRLLRLNLASEKIIQISPEVVDSSDDT
ncbi:RNA-binding protein [Nymphaea thermarum]|nr:RNA-binding protein [Nymphaea thermarum]